MHSVQETIKTAITVIGTTLKYFPDIPGTKKSGRKATIFVRIEKVMGDVTKRVPSIALRRKDIPRWRYS